MNKPVYNNGDRVEIVPDGNFKNDFITGTIVGISIRHIVDFWLVHLDKRLPDECDYPYDVAAIQHTFIRKIGDNCPFPCELRNISVDMKV